MSELVTGEAVALDLRVAALPSRLVASAVDAALQLTALVALGLAVAAAGEGTSDAVAAVLGILLLVTVLVVYPVALETLLRGRTPGKAVMGLRVVRDDGGPIGFRQALVRGLAGAFVEKPGVTVSVLGVVLVLAHPRAKRMGDLLAGTVVVQERVPRSGGQPVAMPPQLAAWAATLELSRLPDALAVSVRQFVQRQADLTPAAREDLGGRLVAAVRAATAPPPPAGTPGWAYLAAVLAERRRREALRLGVPAGPPPRWGDPGAGPPHGGAAGAGQVPTPLPTYVPATPQPVAPEPPAPPSGGFALPS